MADSEKRKFIREEVFNKVLINGEAFGYISDISLGGIKISVMKFEPTQFNDKIKIKILSRQAIGENIELACVVRWKREEGMFLGYGLEFDGPENNQMKLINKYIDYIKSVEAEENEIVVELTEINET